MGILPAGSYLTLQVMAMSITALILPKFNITSFLGPIGAVLVLSFINVFYWDSGLFNSIPLSINARVISLLAINAVIFWIVVKVVPGIDIEGVFPALAAPILFSALTILLNVYAPELTFSEMFTIGTELLGNLREYFLQTSLDQSAVFVQRIS